MGLRSVVGKRKQLCDTAMNCNDIHANKILLQGALILELTSFGKLLSVLQDRILGLVFPNTVPVFRFPS